MSSESVINTVQSKFRQNENILALLEAYEIEGAEHHNRLLVIVNSNNSNAFFAFSLSNYPPINISDLTIVSVLPINNDFFMESNIGTSISQHQFKISSGNDKKTYYFYPDDATCKSKISFQHTITQILSEFKQMESNFGWLSYYKREDLLAIERHFADGSATPKNRESKFKEELEKRRHEYTTFTQMKIYTATWNINNQLPHEIESLSEWLAVSEAPPDIYAVGFQEIDMSAETIFFNETRPDRAWVQKVMAGLHPSAQYEELTSIRLVGMMLTIAIKSSLRSSVLKFQTDMVGTGTLKFGNKGGLAVSILLNEGWLCFINSHLAAHTADVEGRNQDHDDIVKRIQFVDGISRRNIDEHNHIFWLGDLNYRIIPEIPPEQIKRTPSYDRCHLYDQLYLEMKKQRVFRGYTEGNINFPPTYKYDAGTDNWDSSEKARTPSWCDRIMWKGERIKQVAYNSVTELRLSDHKPVFADFEASIQTRNETVYKRVHEEVLKTVDKYENDNQPQITVEQTDIDFGVLKFNELYSRELLVANNCHLPVQFQFSGKDGKGSPVCENWMKISHSRGEIITGNSLSIRLEILIDCKAASIFLRKIRDATSGSKFPLDILVLHVENGRDIFITIFGEYKPSCFGLSMRTMMKTIKPISDYSIRDLFTIENDRDNLIEIPSTYVIPREIWLLIDYLYKNALQTPHLFSISRKYNKNSNINEIRDWLDTRSIEEYPGTPHTTAEALLMILESSPESVLTITESDCIANAEYYEKARELILRKLTSTNRRVFLYICLFLRELQKNYHLNRLDDKILATLFGRAFLRAQNSSSPDFYGYTDDDKDRRRRFMLNFLTNDITEFANSELYYNTNI